MTVTPHAAVRSPTLGLRTLKLGSVVRRFIAGWTTQLYPVRTLVMASTSWRPLGHIEFAASRFGHSFPYRQGRQLGEVLGKHIINHRFGLLFAMLRPAHAYGCRCCGPPFKSEL